MNRELLTYGRTDVTLADALQILPLLELDGEQTLALVYTPDRCLFAKCRGAALIDCDQHTISTNSVFACRVFNGRYELRWHHDHDGCGRAALLATEPVDSLPEGWSEPRRRPFLDEHRNCYLLWGKSGDEQPRDGWTLLYSTRTGDLNVPIGNPDRLDFIQLCTREYLGVVDDYGNVRVMEERLAGLAPYGPA